MTNKQEVEEFCKEHDLTEEQFYGREKIEGYLWLNDLTSIPEGFNPIVGGCLYLNSLTSIPEGFNPIVGSSLLLNGLTSIPEGFNPAVGGSLYFSSLTSIPEGFNPTVGDSLWLDSLTSIPEVFNPTVGGCLYLRGLTSIPEGFNPTVGRNLWLNSLATIPEGFNPTVGRNLWLNSLTTIPEGFNPVVQCRIFYKTGRVSSENKPAHPLTWQEGKYLLADRILCEVLKHKGNVYRVKIAGKREKSYLVTDGTSWAHGETLEEAREDLKYKVKPRDLSDYKDVTVETEFSFEEAVAFYRAVTGACFLGVKNFVEFNNLDTDKSYTVGEMLELVEGEYGEEEFNEFLTLTEKAGNNEK